MEYTSDGETLMLHAWVILFMRMYDLTVLDSTVLEWNAKICTIPSDEFKHSPRYPYILFAGLVVVKVIDYLDSHLWLRGFSFGSGMYVHSWTLMMNT